MCDAASLRSDVVEKQLKLLADQLVAKPLHSKFFSLLTDHDVHKSRSTQWLRQHLHFESESTIFAIQDQVIATKVYETKVMMKLFLQCCVDYVVRLRKQFFT